jgi:hypothetical protein
VEGSRVGEGGGAVDCEEFVALGTTEPELDRIDRIPEFQDWGPERGRIGVSARLIRAVLECGDLMGETLMGVGCAEGVSEWGGFFNR